MWPLVINRAVDGEGKDKRRNGKEKNVKKIFTYQNNSELCKLLRHVSEYKIYIIFSIA